MIEREAPRRPFSRMSELILFGLFGMLAIYGALLPLAPDGGLVPPDLLYCLVAAWMLRTPTALPVLLVAALGLFGDVMLSRPVGLGALGLLLAAEFLRGQRGRIIGAAFPVEWIAVSLTFGLMLAGMQSLIRLAFADPAGWHDLVRHAAATVIAYPIVALAVARGLGLRAGARPV